MLLDFDSFFTLSSAFLCKYLPRRRKCQLGALSSSAQDSEARQQISIKRMMFLTCKKCIDIIYKDEVGRTIDLGSGLPLNILDE